MTSPEDLTASNRATYDRIADLYLERQRQRQAPDAPSFLRLERHFLASLPAGGRLADVGCGPALDGGRFDGAGFDVAGVDLSAGMLAHAARRLPGRVVQADLRALPIAARTLDGIWCAASLLHVPDEHTGVVLGEFERVLRRDGCLAMVAALGRGTVREAVPYQPAESRWFVYRRRESLEAQLEDAGFSACFEETIAGNRLWWCVLARPAGHTAPPGARRILPAPPP